MLLLRQRKEGMAIAAMMVDDADWVMDVGGCCCGGSSQAAHNLESEILIRMTRGEHNGSQQMGITCSCFRSGG